MNQNTMQSSEPVVANRFHLLSLLGRGGMGTVFEAYDPRLGASLAVKVLTHASPANRLSFQREFHTGASLCHPNLVKHYELFASEDRPCFTMELIRGVGFERWLGAEPRFYDARIRLGFTQLAAALRALHGAGMLHCDLKPQNVMVTNDQRLVLFDFGLASDAPDCDLVDFGCDEIFGTPAYMAPEQAAGRGVTEASDLYAFGVMLYEALTGQLPYSGDVDAVLWAKQREAPLPPSQVKRGVPRDLEALCVDLLSLDPTLRPRADEIVARLARTRDECRGELRELHPTGRSGLEEGMGPHSGDRGRRRRGAVGGGSHSRTLRSHDRPRAGSIAGDSAAASLSAASRPRARPPRGGAGRAGTADARRWRGLVSRRRGSIVHRSRSARRTSSI